MERSELYKCTTASINHYFSKEVSNSKSFQEIEHRYKEFLTFIKFNIEDESEHLILKQHLNRCLFYQIHRNLAISKNIIEQRRTPNSYPIIYYLLPAAEAHEIEINLADLYTSAFLPSCGGNEKRAKSIHRFQTARAVLAYWKGALKIGLIALFASTKLPSLYTTLKEFVLR